MFPLITQSSVHHRFTWRSIGLVHSLRGNVAVGFVPSSSVKLLLVVAAGYAKSYQQYQTFHSDVVGSDDDCSGVHKNTNAHTTTSTTTSTSKKKNSFMKRYRINGHSATNNKNGCVGTTGPVSSLSASTSNSYNNCSSSINQLYHDMRTDLPRHMGGHNTAPQPMELLLMSYIGCTQATAYFVSRHLTMDYPASSSSSSLYQLEHMVFDNITVVRDIRSSIHNVPIPIPKPGAVDDPTDDTVTDIQPEHRQQQHISEILGQILVYFSSQATARHGNPPLERPDHPLEQQLRLSSDDDDELERRALYLKALHQHTELRCPIANMILKSGCVINVTWNDGGTLDPSSITKE